MNTALRCIVLATALCATACYSRRPLTGAPAPATRVIALLTDTGVVAMGNAIGAGAVEVEGDVRTADGHAWTLYMTRVMYRGTGSVTWNREVVTFPRNTITNISEKRLDKTKSWVAAGLITVGAFAAARLFGALGADSPTDDDPIPPSIRARR